MLAVVHHLLVSERVPLAEIVGLAADLTHDLLLVEYVGRHDPMFQRLTRGRGHLHEDYTQEVFEQACRERFELARKEAVPECDRCLYVWRKR